MKNKEIRILEDYRTVPDESFWEKFPFNKLPNEVSSDIDILELKNEFLDVKHLMTECQRQRAEKAIANFQTGGSSFQKLPELPGMFCENAKSTYTTAKQ